MKNEKQPRCPFCTSKTEGISGLNKHAIMYLKEETDKTYVYECCQCTYIKVFKK